MPCRVFHTTQARIILESDSMRRSLLMLLLIASPTVSTVVGQNDINVKYDKFGDETIIRTNEIILYSNRKPEEGVTLSAEGRYSGQIPQTPSAVALSLTYRGTGKLGVTLPLHFLLDGARLSHDDMSTDSSVFEGHRNTVVEIISAGMRFNQMERIANAKVVEGRAGAFEFKLTSAQLDILRHFIKTLKTGKA